MVRPPLPYGGVERNVVLLEEEIDICRPARVVASDIGIPEGGVIRQCSWSVRTVSVFELY